MTYERNNNKLILFALMLAFTAAYCATDIFLPSMPTMSTYFNVTENEMQLSIPLFLMAAMFFTPIWGILADVYDLRRVMIWGLWILLLGNLICILAPNLSIFLWGRIFQGAGEIVVSITGYPIIQEFFGDKKSITVTSGLGNLTVLSPMIAPVVGGYLQFYFSWHASFILLTILTLIPMIFLHQLFKRIPAKPSRSFHSAKTIISNYQYHFSNRQFLAYIALFGFLVCGEWCYFTVAPFYFQNTLHIHPEQFGLYLSSSAMFYLVGTALTSFALTHVTPHTVLRWGILICIVTSSLLVFMGLVYPTSPVFITLFFGLFLMGNAAVWGPSTSLAIGSAKKAKGSASSIRSLILCGASSLGGLAGSVINDRFLLPMAVVILTSSMISYWIFNNIPKSENEKLG